MKYTIFTFPTILTLMRLTLAPLFLPFIIVYSATSAFVWLQYFQLSFFVLLAATDFFDGILARSYKQESSLGSLLDPIADKFLLLSTLIGLLVINRVNYFWVVVFIGREIFILGLRLIAMHNGITITVSQFGKMKTIVQFCYLAFLLSYSLLSSFDQQLIVSLDYGLLSIALLLCVGSAYAYAYNFYKQIHRRLYEGYFI